jgi:serine phosphatase RsbU (regulator of sigma subunit)
MQAWRLIVVSEREHSFVDMDEQRPIVRLGRAPENDIVVKDDMASRKHCIVERDASGLLRVRDLKSFNGTYLNERRIREEPFSPWDALRVGRTKLFLVERGEGAPPVPGASTSASALVSPVKPDASGPADPVAPSLPADAAAGDDPERAMSATRTIDPSSAELLTNKDVRRVIDDLLRREREEVERETARRLRDESAPAVLASIEGLSVRARRFGPGDGGGDFFDVFQEPDAPEDLRVCLGSVSGVGVAACVAASAARHALRGTSAGRDASPRQTIDLCREMLSRTLHPGSAVSLLLGRVSRSGRVQLGALGGTGVLHWHAATETVEVIRAPARRDEEAPRSIDVELTLRADDRLLLASDGAGSIRRVGEQEPLGVDRLAQALREAAKEAPREVVARVAAGFDAYVQGTPDRDATIVVLALAR